MSSDSDYTVGIEILGGILAYVRNVGCKLLRTAFCIAHLSEVFVYVN